MPKFRVHFDNGEKKDVTAKTPEKARGIARAKLLTARAIFTDTRVTKVKRVKGEKK